MAGRPTKQGLDYFPLDVDFFGDDKIEYVTARFDEKGELIALKLLCNIYRNGYFIKWDNDKATIFAKRAGRNISPSLVKEVVEELVKRDFFDKVLFNSLNILTSNGIQKRYLQAVSERKEIEIISDYWLIDLPKNTQKQAFLINRLNNSINRSINSINLPINTQSKVKESKVNYINNVDDNNRARDKCENHQQHQQFLDKLESDAFLRIKKHYEKHLGNLLSPTASQKICDFIGIGVEDSLICKAIDKSIDNGARNWVYAEGILNNLVLANILTVEQYETHEANRAASSRAKKTEKQSSSSRISKSKYANFNQRDWNFDEIEKTQFDLLIQQNNQKKE